VRGGPCLWFAANEHCGVPVAGAPSGTEETGVSRAGPSPGAGLSLLCCKLPCRSQEQKVEVAAVLLMPISSFFFPVLNSFPSACPGCCFYGVYCQPGDLCPFGGCFPGSLSTSQCPLPAGWRSGTVGSAAAGSLAPRGCHPRPCQCARGRFRCRPCHDCCAGMSRRATRQRALAGRCVSASEKLLWYRLL